MAGAGAFFGAGATLFFGVTGLPAAVTVLLFGEATFTAVCLALIETGDFLSKLATFLAADVFFIGDAFFTLAVASASIFFADAIRFLGDRLTGGSGVAEALILPGPLPL